MPSDEVVLRVKSDYASYWRALAFDKYDGRGWSMGEPEKVTSYVEESGGQVIRLPLPEGQSARGQRFIHTIYVETDQANLVFSAWPPLRIYFPTGMGLGSTPTTARAARCPSRRTCTTPWSRTCPSTTAPSWPSCRRRPSPVGLRVTRSCRRCRRGSRRSPSG